MKMALGGGGQSAQAKRKATAEDTERGDIPVQLPQFPPPQTPACPVTGEAAPRLQEVAMRAAGWQEATAESSARPRRMDNGSDRRWPPATPVSPPQHHGSCNPGRMREEGMLS